jgi:hypothetical protein
VTDLECASKLNAFDWFIIQQLSELSSSGASGWRCSTTSNGKKCSFLGEMLPSADRSRRSGGRPIIPEGHCADGSPPGEKIRQTQKWGGNNRIFQPETEETVLNTFVSEIGSEGSLSRDVSTGPSTRYEETSFCRQ